MFDINERRVEDLCRGRRQRIVEGLHLGLVDLGALGLAMSASVSAGQLNGRLRQPTINPSKGADRSTQIRTTEQQLCERAGEHIHALLRQFGASAVGTKQIVLSDNGRQRNELWYVALADAEHILAVAFVLARVLPMARDVKLSQAASNI